MIKEFFVWLGGSADRDPPAVHGEAAKKLQAIAQRWLATCYASLLRYPFASRKPDTPERKTAEK
jgi:hypothetical protein